MVVKFYSEEVYDFSSLSDYVHTSQNETLAAYRAKRDLVEEQHNRETTILSGGYSYRQLFELVQNAADAVVVGGEPGGIIRVELEPDSLRVCNTGAPLDQDGIKALLQADTSPKRDNQIGRFGIGFKSLLMLGGRIDILSRSIGLRFDPDKCRQRIRNEIGLPSGAPAPGMRLAECLDPKTPESLLLKEKYQCFDTIVTAELRKHEAFEKLRTEIDTFPAAFLLFLDVDVTLEFVVEGVVYRTVQRVLDDTRKNYVIIAEGEELEGWRLFKAQVEITDQDALDDATAMQARGTVPISWAVRDGGRDQVGKFWAFFPTQSDNGLKGILNAPWKLNNDRTSLIDGAWNKALMEAAANRVAGWMGHLATEEDPGAVLDAYPRKLDREGDLHGPLTRKLADLIYTKSTLPDARGRSQTLTRLKRHPVSDHKTLTGWADISDNPSGLLLHPSCYRIKDRISRLDGVLIRAGVVDTVMMPEPLNDWFRAHTIDTPEASARAVSVAAMVAEVPLMRATVENVRIVMDRAGELCVPKSCAIYEDGVKPGSLKAVSEGLLASPDTVKALGAIGVKTLGRDVSERELEKALSEARDRDTLAWKTFWEQASRSEPAMLDSFLKKNIDRLRLPTREGSWVWREEYVEGCADVPPSAALDTEVFDSLGITLPRALLGWPKRDEGFRTSEMRVLRDEHGQWLKETFVTLCEMQRGRRPRGRPLLVKDTIMPGGSALALRWSGSDVFGQAITQHLLNQAAVRGDALFSTRIRSRSNPEDYPTLAMPHPVWLLACKLRLKISEAILPVQALTPALVILAGNLDFEREASWRWLRQLFVSVAEQAQELSLQRDEFEYRALRPEYRPLNRASWMTILRAAETITRFHDDLVGLWFAAQEAGATPELVPTAHGPVPLSKATVTTNRNHATDRAGQGVFCLSELGCIPWQAAGATRLPDRASWTYDAAPSPPIRLLSALPELSTLSDLVDDLRSIKMLRVERLVERLGMTTKPCPAHFDPKEKTLLVDGQSVGPKGREDELTTILGVIGNALSGDEDCRWSLPAHVLARKCCEIDESAVPTAQTPRQTAHRLAKLVGDDVTAFTNLLPGRSEELVPFDLSVEQVAELTLAVHGPSLLKMLVKSGALAAADPPDRFGGTPARDFVRRHGLPMEFASGAVEVLSPSKVVQGPSALPKLHDYQEEVVAGIRQLLESGPGRRRAVVSLPTGGGKTRVTVQAAVELVLKGHERRSVLWIAQKEELCEQAVQSFSEVWRAKGNAGESLHVVRYWGGLTKRLDLPADAPSVVVATIDTLNSRLQKAESKSLRDIGLMIVDECHGAVTASYSDVLRHLGLQLGNQVANNREIPLIGLSATPWRGHNEVESHRLAARFDNCWLPHNQESLHDRLLQRHILCDLDYRELKLERDVILTDEERSHVKQFGSEPSSLLERLSHDDARNEAIVGAVEEAEAQSVLLFANTKPHSEYLAVFLNRRGIRAAAISADTDRQTRRYFIDAFRKGEIRVLCNYGVLTTGFDAPRTDMVVIARPVFSPVLYMQMVGRGLRGTANGGTESCKIVTVADNLQEYSSRLAYHECSRYFEAAI